MSMCIVYCLLCIVYCVLYIKDKSYNSLSSYPIINYKVKDEDGENKKDDDENFISENEKCICR
jgi:hypothetical protein